MIDQKDVTFVVQGPIYTPISSRFGLTTAEVLKSIRIHFPDSRIILSTWKKSPLEGLEYDELVESDDPGSCSLPKGAVQSIPSNVNRLIISSRCGLDKVSTKYACKTRTDVLFCDHRFLGLKRDYSRAEGTSFFNERLVVSRLFNRKAKLFPAYCFHYSDIFLFGLTEDLQKVFCVPLASPESLRHYFNESYIWSHCFAIKSLSMNGKEKSILSEKLLANEFVVYSENQLSIFLPFEKVPIHFKLYKRATTYSHLYWLILYLVEIRRWKFLKFFRSCLSSIGWSGKYIYHFGEYVYKMKRNMASIVQ